MRLALRIAWRSLVSRPGRTLTSILGIAVGIAAVLSVLIVDHNTILTEVLRRPSYSGQPDIEIRPVAMSARNSKIPEALTRDSDVRQVLPLFQSRIRAVPADPKRSRDLSLFAIDKGAADRFNAWEIEEGDGFLRNDADEVLLPKALAAEFGVTLGDTIGLQRSLPSRSECRDGEVVQVADAKVLSTPRPYRVVGLLKDDHLGRRRTVIVPIDSGLDLFQDSAVQVIYWARLAPETIYQDVKSRLKDVFVIEKPKAALVGERVDQRAFRKSINIAACLSLLLGLFVIYNAFSLSLVERVREIGLLRAIGLSSGEVSAAVLLEGAALAVLGAVSGLVLSIAIVLIMKEFGITTLGWNKPLEIHELPWTIVLAVLAAGMFAAMLGVIAPLLRVRRISVIEAVRAGTIAYKPDPSRFARALFFAILPGLLLFIYWVTTPPLGERREEVFKLAAWIATSLTLTFGLALLAPRLVQAAVVLFLRIIMVFRPVERPIAVASTRGSQHRVFGSTIGIALVLAAVMSIHGITQSLKDESSRFADQTMDGRVFVRAKFIEKEKVLAAADVPGLAALYTLSAEVHSPFPLRGVDPEAACRFVPQLRDNPELAAKFRAGESIVMSEFLAQENKYSPGETVPLTTYRGPKNVEIAAISDDFGYFPDDRNFAVMALSEFTRIFCVGDAVGTQYVFHFEDGQDLGAGKAAIEARIPPEELQWVRTADEIKSFYRTDMNRDFWIFQVVLLLTGLLAFVGLWNSLTVALLERRREIGLLRTLGFTSGQLGGMLAAESAALGLVGGGLAVAAGYPVSRYLVQAVEVISRLDVRYVATRLDMAVIVLIAVALALLATVPPALRVKSMVVASATRME